MLILPRICGVELGKHTTNSGILRAIMIDVDRHCGPTKLRQIWERVRRTGRKFPLPFLFIFSFRSSIPFLFAADAEARWSPRETEAGEPEERLQTGVVRRCEKKLWSRTLVTNVPSFHAVSPLRKQDASP